MRDPVSVFFYPDALSDHDTLKKAILFFDEIHFMDRPSFTFEGGWGSIGMASPLREWKAKFRSDGVPLYVHSAPDGPVRGTFLEAVAADVNDLEFLRRFQAGIKKSPTFRDRQIAPGNYGDGKTNFDVCEILTSLDVPKELSRYAAPMSLLGDTSIRPFVLDSSASCLKTLVSNAALCSAKMNMALNLSTTKGFIPLADARPFGDLLGAKYARAVDSLPVNKSHIHVTDLSFAIFDELISTETINRLSIKDVINYRKSSEVARNEFLDHLHYIQAKQASIGADGDYVGAITKIVETEIVPAAKAFRNKLSSTIDTFVGSIAKGAVGAAGGASAMNVFGDLSWHSLLGLAGGASAYIAKTGIDAILSERGARRECAISYVLSLET